MDIQGAWFIDGEGRRRLLRGVNLSGSSKVPVVPDGRTHLPLDHGRHREVSFVGRPFPLDEADEHLGRLRRWGFTCLRLLTTWEAIEHAGPGVYDEAYLDEFRAVVARAGEHGFAVFVDPHQDVWSRMTGGDGAPGWTLEAVGFDVTRLDDSEAAFTQARQGETYRQMSWPGNARRLAAGTMFALFFAGDRVAPSVRVDGEPVQRYLRRHYLGALRAVAERLTGLDCVLGFDAGNEPSAGLLGIEDLAEPLPPHVGGAALTGLQVLSVPAGFPARVPVMGPLGITPEHPEHVLLNPGGVSAWRDPDADVWRREGVWDVQGGVPRLLRPDHFAGIDVVKEGVEPLTREVAATVRSVLPGAAIFVEGEPGGPPPAGVEGPVVNASHWYDVLTLVTKHYEEGVTVRWGSFDLVTGEEAVREARAADIGLLAATSSQDLGGVPTLVGEYGVPFDLDGGEAYRTGDFSEQERALTAYHDALDANLVHATLWNYTPDNTNDHGDGWNGEDLSIYSADQRSDPADPDSGARALRGFSRPCLHAAAGTPLLQSFRGGVYRLDVDVDPSVAAPTLVYCPPVHFPGGAAVEVSSGTVAESDGHVLAWSGAEAGPQRLTIRTRGDGGP